MTKREQHEKFVQECKERKDKNKEAMIRSMREKIKLLERKIITLETEIGHSVK